MDGKELMDLIRQRIAMKQGIRGQCWMCGSNDWNLNDKAGLIPALNMPFAQFQMSNTPVVLPVIMLTCGNCGTIWTLSAKALGFTVDDLPTGADGIFP